MVYIVSLIVFACLGWGSHSRNAACFKDTEKGGEGETEIKRKKRGNNEFLLGKSVMGSLNLSVFRVLNKNDPGWHLALHKEERLCMVIKHYCVQLRPSHVSSRSPGPRWRPAPLPWSLATWMALLLTSKGWFWILIKHVSRISCSIFCEPHTTCRQINPLKEWMLTK